MLEGEGVAVIAIVVAGHSSRATHPSSCSAIPCGHTHPITHTKGQMSGGLSLLAQVTGQAVPQSVCTFPLLQTVKRGREGGREKGD